MRRCLPTCSTPPACTLEKSHGQRKFACVAVPIGEDSEAYPVFPDPVAHGHPRDTPLGLCSSYCEDIGLEHAGSGLKYVGAVLASSTVLGMCCGDPEQQAAGLDPSELPEELLEACEELGLQQLELDLNGRSPIQFQGPVNLLKRAFVCTESVGSTSVLLATLDNSWRVNSTVYPMLAMVGIGDCELTILRCNAATRHWEVGFSLDEVRRGESLHTGIHLPSHLKRYDLSTESLLSPLNVIESGSIVQYIAVLEGDLIVLSSPAVHASLGTAGVVDICSEVLRGHTIDALLPAEDRSLIVEDLADSLVFAAQAKPDLFQNKITGDTSVVISSVVDWNSVHSGSKSKREESGRLGIYTPHKLDKKPKQGVKGFLERSPTIDAALPIKPRYGQGKMVQSQQGPHCAVPRCGAPPCGPRHPMSRCYSTTHHVKGGGIPMQPNLHMQPSLNCGNAGSTCQSAKKEVALPLERHNLEMHNRIMEQEMKQVRESRSCKCTHF